VSTRRLHLRHNKIAIITINTSTCTEVFRLLDLGLKVLALAGSACVNPILYCWSNDNIRGELMSSIRQRMLGGGGKTPRSTIIRGHGHAKQPLSPSNRRSIQKDGDHDGVVELPAMMDSSRRLRSTRLLATATVVITTATTWL